jgi:lysophospholipase L1-like esterase
VAGTGKSRYCDSQFNYDFPEAAGLAVPGSSTVDWIDFFEDPPDAGSWGVIHLCGSQKYRFKYVVLQIGSNDLNYKLVTTPEGILVGYKTLLALIHKALPKVTILLLSMLPRNTPINPLLLRANALTKAYFKAKPTEFTYVEYLDLNPYFYPNEYIDPSLRISDKVHLSIKGYQLYNTSLKSYIDTRGRALGFYC